jgi:hypothetical protein
MTRWTNLVAALALLSLAPACQEAEDYAETVAGAMDRAKVAEMKVSMKALGQALEGHVVDHGRYPDRLADLADVASGRLRTVDSWENPLRYRTDSGGYELLSDGPDAQPGTEDDIALRDGRVE